MSRFIEKILYAAFTIFVALTTIFFVIRMSPGDPVETVLGQKATQEEIMKLKTNWVWIFQCLLNTKNI